MLKNDFRYIIKKIIIGIGIFIGIFYFKSCNVSALDDQWFTLKESKYQPSFPCFSDNSIYTYVIKGNTYQFKVQNGGIYLNDHYITTIDNRCRGFILGTNSNNQVEMYYFTNQGYFISLYKDYGTEPHLTDFPILVDNFYNSGNVVKMVFNGSNLVSSGNATCTNITLHNKQICSYIGNSDFNIYGMRMLQTYYNSSNKYKFYYTDFGTPVIVPPTESKIISLNPQPILSDDNSVLLGYDFTLEFDNFSTDNFVYKYRVGNGRTLIFTENNYQLSIRNNDTLYVWSEDLEGNLIDSQTFTITNVGNLYHGEYSIDFTYKDIAPSDTENSTGLSNIIDRVDINITYLPKTNTLKYQYQFVNSGGSLGSQNWKQVNDNNSKNDYTFVAHDNGILYTRILDIDDNVVASNTFTIDSIGKLKLFKDNNIGGIFSGITNNISYSGPIYSLILMPINFINTIYSNSSNTCQPYKLGTLLNNDIYFECVDFSDYVGSDLYHLIDILCASGVIYGIALFIKKKYNQFTTLSDNENDIM